MKFLSSLQVELTSKDWWKAASMRALRTAVAVFVPFIVATTLVELDWLVIGSTVGLAVIASYLTSLAGIREVTHHTVPAGIAIAIRGIKTFAQTALSYIGTSVLFHEVNWSNILLLSASATIVSILQGTAFGAPESRDISQVKHASNVSGPSAQG